MKNLAVAVILVFIGVIAWYFGVHRQDETEPAAVPVTIPEPVVNTVSTPPPVRFPVPAPEPVESETPAPAVVTEPLPGLDDSSTPFKDRMAGIHDVGELDNLFIFDSIIRHFVVTVDNMTAQVLPQKFGFYRTLAGVFAVQKQGQETFVLDPVNYQRYTPYVRFFQALDLQAVTSLYFEYYPLFQQAYVELGYPDRYFNDRFVEVIDHLLQAPEIEDGITLLQPKVYFTFTDPELEALSAGQKILIRMGPANTRQVKQRLRILRALLTSTQPAR